MTNGAFWTDIWQGYVWPLLLMVMQSVVLLVALLVTIAFLLLMDRKVWAAVQLRRGPNVVGPFGLLQSFADLLKFVLKEPLIPAGADKGVFLLAPLVASVLALAAWAVIPLNENAWVSTASSWAAGPRTRNTRFWGRYGPRHKWCPTRSRSGS